MKTPRLLKRIRIGLSIAILVLITLLFLNVGGWYRSSFGFLAKAQFLPSAFSFALGIFIFWLGVTLVVGRAYCSSMCPLGTLQDFFAWLRFRKKKHFYHYSRPRTKTRYGILIIFLACLMLGLLAFPLLIDPYSAYGRIVNSTLLPIRNIIADGGFENLMTFSLLGTAVGIITLVLVAIFSYKKGRFLCNVICPVGSTLSLISRHSIWRMEIDTDKCIGCGLCAFKCKSQCIDLNDHTIDTSRCVMCFNCLDACSHDALHFTMSRKRLSTPLMQQIPTVGEAPSVNMDRRKFITIAGVCTVAGKLASANNAVDQLSGSKPIKRRYTVTPPGTTSRNNFHAHCTSCMLCVSNCPNRVLKASITEYGVLNIMQPYMDFDRASCKVGCTRCTRICPTGALKPLTREEKLHSPIGLAQVIVDNCIGCGTCEGVCPYEAIKMTQLNNELYIPVVDPNKCIGCGACQLNCPASPVKAIWVEGLP